MGWQGVEKRGDAVRGRGKGYKEGRDMKRDEEGGEVKSKEN